MIDRKFEFTAVNPCNKKVYTQENTVVFLAKDECLVPALEAYLDESMKRRCDTAHVESIMLLIERVVEFQKQESKIPDMVSDCEIDRCVGGLIG